MKLKTLLLSATLAAASLSAAAVPVVLTPSGPDTFFGSFTQSVEGLFVDEFSFSPTSFSGVVSVVLTGLTGPVSFYTASLNGQGFSYFPELGEPTFSFQATVSSDVPLSLTVFGAVLDSDGNPAGLGSYSGTINAVAAVPEPQTLGLLLAGLGALALTARRKRSTV